MSVIYLPFVFMGGYFGEPKGSPVLSPVCQPDLSARPVSRTGGGFLETVQTKEHDHDNI
ncbi:MAG: hypothetical protein JSS37_08205 [Proteobacteria bacterium]|nr:hypothetical protein [Pseudomonadota bacterium]